jgi:hypothetical protein
MEPTIRLREPVMPPPRRARRRVRRAELASDAESAAPMQARLLRRRVRHAAADGLVGSRHSTRGNAAWTRSSIQVQGGMHVVVYPPAPAPPSP